MRWRMPFIIVALAAIALVGSGWLTVISRWRQDSVVITNGRTHIELKSSEGQASATIMRRPPGLFEQDPGWTSEHYTATYEEQPIFCGLDSRPATGYYCYHDPAKSLVGRGGGGGELVSPDRWHAGAPVIALNCPPLGVIGLVGLVLAGKALKSRRRQKMGLCRRCGYDLRATPGRCPECGKSTEMTVSPAV